LFVGLSWFASKQTGITSGWLGAARRIISTSVPARIATIVVMISVLLLGIVWLAGQNLASKANERTSVLAASDGTTRKDIWKATYALIKRHPLTGVGFGAYFLAITEYQESSGRLRVQQAHNDYLDLMAAGGVIAVVLAAWFVILIIRRVRTTLSSKDRYRRAVALGALAGIISVSVHSFVDFGLQVTGVAVVCAALMVIAVVDVPFSEELGNRRVRRRRSPRSSDQIAGHIA
jgi:O-antigen ligase